MRAEFPLAFLRVILSSRNPLLLVLKRHWPSMLWCQKTALGVMLRNVYAPYCAAAAGEEDDLVPKKQPECQLNHNQSREGRPDHKSHIAQPSGAFGWVSRPHA